MPDEISVKYDDQNYLYDIEITVILIKFFCDQARMSGDDLKVGNVWLYLSRRKLRQQKGFVFDTWQRRINPKQDSRHCGLRIKLRVGSVWNWPRLPVAETPFNLWHNTSNRNDSIYGFFLDKLMLFHDLRTEHTRLARDTIRGKSASRSRTAFIVNLSFHWSFFGCVVGRFAKWTICGLLTVPQALRSKIVFKFHSKPERVKRLLYISYLS